MAIRDCILGFGGKFIAEIKPTNSPLRGDPQWVPSLTDDYRNAQRFTDAEAHAVESVYGFRVDILRIS